MSEGAWVISSGKVWNEEYQAWEDAWGGSIPGYIYDQGNECTGVTGGWKEYTDISYSQGNLNSHTSPVKETNRILLQDISESGNRRSNIGTIHSVQIGNYIYIQVRYAHSQPNNYPRAILDTAILDGTHTAVYNEVWDMQSNYTPKDTSNSKIQLQSISDNIGTFKIDTSSVKGMNGIIVFGVWDSGYYLYSARISDE